MDGQSVILTISSPTSKVNNYFSSPQPSPVPGWFLAISVVVCVKGTPSYSFGKDILCSVITGIQCGDSPLANAYQADNPGIFYGVRNAMSAFLALPFQ